jgi:hypothetical protein
MEWKPLAPEPFRTTQLADTWETMDGLQIKANWEIEKGIPIVVDIDDEPSSLCQRCWDVAGQEDDEWELYYEDPESLSEEARKRIRREIRQLRQRLNSPHQHHLHEYQITLQCAATTKKGRRCKNTTTSWDYVNDPAFADDRPADKPFTDPDWWVCQKHAPECPHCDFHTSGSISGSFRLKLCVRHDEVGEPIGRGLHCWMCLCTFDPPP